MMPNRQVYSLHSSFLGGQAAQHHCIVTLMSASPLLSNDISDESVWHKPVDEIRASGR